MTRSNLHAVSTIVALVLLASCGSTDNPGSSAATTTTPGVVATTTIAATTVPTTNIATTSSELSVQARARAVYAEAHSNDNASRETEAMGRFDAAESKASSDQSAVGLLAVPGRDLETIYGERLYAWQRLQGEISAIGEPYTSLFGEMQRGDEQLIDWAKSAAACDHGCNAGAVRANRTTAQETSSAALDRFLALIGGS